MMTGHNVEKKLQKLKTHYKNEILRMDHPGTSQDTGDGQGDDEIFYNFTAPAA